MKATPQTHILSPIPITLPSEPPWSPHLQNNRITEDDDDNPMPITFIQHHVWNNHRQHLHVRLSHQSIFSITLAEHYANPVIRCETGETITSYEKLANYPLAKGTWTTTMAMELGNIAQGHQATNTPGKSTVFFLDNDAIKNIPTNRKITYACILVGYRPHKPDPS